MADITIRNGDTSQHQHHNAEQKHTDVNSDRHNCGHKHDSICSTMQPHRGWRRISWHWSMTQPRVCVLTWQIPWSRVSCVQRQRKTRYTQQLVFLITLPPWAKPITSRHISGPQN